MTLAFIFPGQGSQEVGMGKALIEAFPSARAVFEEVDQALGQNLTKIILEGPIETLTLTENAQPALMAVSLAAVRALEAEFGVGVERAAFVAGHSLGEYSALAAAGALSVPDAARLLKLRGQAMQRAVPVGEGAMASLIGPKVDMALAEAAAAKGAEAGVCVVANDNNPGNIVISGSKAGVDAAIAAAKELGGKPFGEFRGILDWPLKGRVVVPFGPRLDPRYGTKVPHNGVDITPETASDEVRAVFPGKVLFAAPFEGFGTTVVLHHAGRGLTLYGGLVSARVAKDDVVSLGQALGGAGEVVYFELRLDNRPEDPQRWLR